MTSPQQINPFDLIVATNLATKIDSMFKEISLLAESFGTTITLQQVITGVLNSGLDMTERVITRDEFLAIHEYVMSRRAELAQAQAGTPQPGPEDTAHAGTAAEADRLADHWGERITEATFTFEIPDLGEPDCG